MAVCPKCSFALVLLPERLRYKCAKCGSLYLQRFIDNREFQRWNRKQREITKEETKRYFEEIWQAYKTLVKPKNKKPVREKRPKLTEEEKKQKRKEYYLRNREEILKRNRIWAEKNKNSIREYKKEYKQANKDRLSVKWREWYQKNKEREQEKIRLRKARNIGCYNEIQKRYRLRKKEKALALQATKNEVYTPKEGDSLSQMADSYLFNYFYAWWELRETKATPIIITVMLSHLVLLIFSLKNIFELKAVST